ncbi:hypothetical protein Hbl1158_14085 [Halobaculum sp. CBA1158]|uniref:DUF7384 family protein n=1 Tax=Halobaculum sp. CBA1158 TaxID=2904243 RepID=UPI001F3BC0E4|nr:hypothetical protein [Halobaculum sp. CBA1158]UIO99638.1 hypothetical protein Hbl1158_14085 [Halobaculum sp. CBA1158]
METWAALFDRAEAFGVDEAAIRSTLAERRDPGSGRDDRGAAVGDASDGRADASDRASDGPAPDPPSDDPSPARVVADADVLAADLLVGGDPRAALDGLRGHSWTTLVASDDLVADAETVIAALADSDLAADWRERTEAWREPVAHPAGDHPALASAYRGGAMHVLSSDDRLTAAGTGAGLNDRFPVSVREPRAFATLFDAESLYPEACEGAYPGPDRDPRA